MPDQRHPVALAQRHGDVPQRLDDRHPGAGADLAAGPAEHGLLQRAGLRVEDREVDGGADDVDAGAMLVMLPQTQYATRAR